MKLKRVKGLRILTSIFPIIIFLLIHIVFYWIVYKHSPFEHNYFETYLSGYFEIYLFIALILIVGITIKAMFFCSLFFVFAVYGEIQMLFGYWKLGLHPTMEPSMMQFVLCLSGFILGSVVEVITRVINVNFQKHKQD